MMKKSFCHHITKKNGEDKSLTKEEPNLREEY